MHRLLAAVRFAVLFTGSVPVAAGTDDEVLDRAHVRIVNVDPHISSCRGVGAGGGELGYTAFRFQYDVSGGRRESSGRYTGKVTFSLGDVAITMPASIAWPGMTAKEREDGAELRRAIFHHEVGHVRVAEAVRDQLNAREPIVAPDPFAFGSAADAIGRDGFEAFRTRERDYDALTDHGRKQHAAPGALAGPDTILICR